MCSLALKGHELKLIFTLVSTANLLYFLILLSLNLKKISQKCYVIKCDFGNSFVIKNELKYSATAVSYNVTLH